MEHETLGNGSRHASLRFCEMNNEDLNATVSSFTHEARKKNEERYPVATLVITAAGLQANMNSTSNRNVDFSKATSFPGSPDILMRMPISQRRPSDLPQQPILGRP